MAMHPDPVGQYLYALGVNACGDSTVVQNGFLLTNKLEKDNMNKTLIAAFAALMVACSSTPAVELPEPQLLVGSTFVVPCNEHGSHVQTIKGARLGILYDISGDDGSAGTMVEEHLLQFLEMYGIVVDTTVVVR
jgi:hypothetical protein